MATFRLTYAYAMTGTMLELRFDQGDTYDAVLDLEASPRLWDPTAYTFDGGLVCVSVLEAAADWVAVQTTPQTQYATYTVTIAQDALVGKDFASPPAPVAFQAPYSCEFSGGRPDPIAQPVVVTWKITPNTPENREMAASLMQGVFDNLYPGDAFPYIPPSGPLSASVEYARLTVVPSVPLSEAHYLVIGQQVFLDESAPDYEVPVPEILSLGEYGFPSVQVEWLGNVYPDSYFERRVINRNPEPNEVQVPHLIRGAPTPIKFQLILPSDYVYVERIRVYVDGLSVLNQGVFEHGYLGSVVRFGDTTTTVGVSFARDIPFESAQRIEVRVEYTPEGWSDWSETWAFTWLDETQPTLGDAIAEDIAQVRAVFSEPMSDDVLEPARFALTRVSKYAFEPEVVAVERAGASAVQLRTNGPLTFGATYKLTASGVTDVNENQLDPAGAECTFVAYSPPVPEGRRFLLWDFVPQLHKRADRETGELEALVRILQEPTDVLLYEIDRMATLADPDQAPEDFVDAMLVDMGCPLDMGGADLGDKRKVLSLLLGIYQQKGTTEGLIKAARALLGLEVRVHPLNEGGWMLGVHKLGNYDTTWLGPETSFQRFAFEVEVAAAAGFFEWGQPYLVDAVLRGEADAYLEVPAPIWLGFGEADLARLIELTHVMRPAHTHLRRTWVRVPVAY